ncbi:hypothetical protein H4R18_001561 [Coemansia javaensis]|uniref:NADP-dependent oxidoreductase domain-containing protein n=1 Tax=Coemansia javaensis TaxID=2761396 RepID=A0A9W8LKE7_9FUNG|nr:hypothetical protein H4R18_001561 [Coemansia javaensis]
MTMLPRHLVLSNGLSMPAIGLGTWQQRDGAVVERVVRQALAMGYRLIDTASAYRNEAPIGRALQAAFSDKGARLCRDDVWITSKLAPKEQGFEGATAAVCRSLENLRTDYIDLYLVHWPGVSGEAPESPVHRGHREGSWKALEALYKRGTLRAIGVSNYTVRHLEEMKEYAEILPMVNQCEMHPLCPQQELRRYCRQNGIAFTAYASLGEAALLEPGNNIAELDEVVRRHPGVSRAQILLLWGLHHGAAVIPKASSMAHLQENWSAPDHALSAAEMAALDGISAKHHRHFCWDPENVA